MKAPFGWRTVVYAAIGCCAVLGMWVVALLAQTRAPRPPTHSDARPAAPPIIEPSESPRRPARAVSSIASAPTPVASVGHPRAPFASEASATPEPEALAERDRLSVQPANETTDPSWATRRESELRVALESFGARVDAVECRRTLCSVSLNHEGRDRSELLHQIGQSPELPTQMYAYYGPPLAPDTIDLYIARPGTDLR